MPKKMKDFASLLANSKNSSDPCAGGAGVVGAGGILADDERWKGFGVREKKLNKLGKGEKTIKERCMVELFIETA